TQGSFRGASGSSQITAKLLLPAGTSLHLSGGDTSLPSPVHCLGMVVPSWKAVLVTFMASTPLSRGVTSRLSPLQPERSSNTSIIDNHGFTGSTSLRVCPKRCLEP